MESPTVGTAMLAATWAGAALGWESPEGSATIVGDAVPCPRPDGEPNGWMRITASRASAPTSTPTAARRVRRRRRAGGGAGWSTRSNGGSAGGGPPGPRGDTVVVAPSYGSGQ